MNPWLAYVSGPVVGAFIGWLTNWIAVKMLFHPRREVRVLGFRFCGLIPRRRADLTRRSAEIIEEEMVTREDLRKIVESVNLAPPIFKAVEERVEQFLTDQVDDLPKLVRLFVPRELLHRIKQSFMQEVERVLPRLTEDMMDAISAKANFKQLVVEKLNAVEIEKFESLVNRLARTELRSIELVGGVLGFLIGTFQSLWLWFAR